MQVYFWSSRYCGNQTYPSFQSQGTSCTPQTLPYKADNRIMIGKPRFQPSSSLFIRQFHIYSAMSRRSRKWRYDNTCLQLKLQTLLPFQIKRTISLNRRFPSTKNKSQSRKHSTQVSWESQIHYSPLVRWMKNNSIPSHYEPHSSEASCYDESIKPEPFSLQVIYGGHKIPPTSLKRKKNLYPQPPQPPTHTNYINCSPFIPI